MKKTLKFIILMVFVVNCDSLSFNLKDGIRATTTRQFYDGQLLRPFERVGLDTQRLIHNLETKFEEKLVETKKELETKLTKIHGMSSGLEVVQSDLKKFAAKAEASQELQKNDTSKMKADIQEMRSRMSEMNSTMREAQIGIPVAVFKSTNLNATFERVKEGLEATWGVLFDQVGHRTMVGKSCKELQSKYNLTKSGEYFIQPSLDKSRSIKIYCDMEGDGGGWSVIQRRGVREIPKAQRENFTRNWTDYENGFGQVGDDHWIGLQTIHLLTYQDACGTELMVNLMKWDGTVKYGRHTQFRVSGSEDDYLLSVEGNQGNATTYDEDNTMLTNNNATFATFDRDTRRYCVANVGGAWWHHGWGCTAVNLNGEYSEDGKMGIRKDKKGIYWYSRDTWSSTSTYSFKKTTMKIKSKC